MTSKPRPERRIYAWPDVPDQTVLFPYIAKDSIGGYTASQRIYYAAKMVWHYRQWGWKPHVRSTPGGVLFWWSL